MSGTNIFGGDPGRYVGGEDPTRDDHLATKGYVDAHSGGAPVDVTDGVHTVTSVTELDFTSGATVTDAGGGVAQVAVSGGSQTLAAVLAEGADTGGIEIVSVSAEEAVVTRRATASNDGNAVANSYATGEAGNAAAIASATATDGTADVSRAANSDTWRANANTNAIGADRAQANTTATTTGDGNAECKNIAIVGGAGSALATLQASDPDETHIIVIELRATASGQSMTITGLPTSDPGVGNKAWLDSGVLKVTAAA